MSAKKKPPITAIVTRTKNRPFLLERAIKSVLAQTSKDYIHVVLNDGGDKDVVEKLLAKYPDPRRIVIHNEVSVGLTPALNQVIRAADSDFIAILDDDDRWHPERLERSSTVLSDRNAQATVVPMEIVTEEVEDSRGRVREIERIPHPESWSGEVSLYRQIHRNFLSNGAVHYARELFEKLGGYDETLPVAEDWDFGVRLLLEVNVEQVRSDEALVQYHQRPSIKSGDVGNSVHAGVLEQERSINLLRNKYLREDLKRGSLGIGYIMNNTEQNVNDIVRLEAHINRATQQVVQEIDAAKRAVINSRLQNKIRRALR